MKKDLLSITELAKLRRVTSETLRYYDRIGLLKPVYTDPATKYRYYSIRQYERLGTIKELRQLGMSVESILDYFHDRNVKKSTDILMHHYQLLQEEIRQKMLLSKTLSRKLLFLKELAEPPVSDVVFECRFPKRYMITFGEEAGGPREHAYAFTKLERYLDETAPILASDRVGVYADERLLEKARTTFPPSPCCLWRTATLNPSTSRKSRLDSTSVCTITTAGWRSIPLPLSSSRITSASTTTR